MSDFFENYAINRAADKNVFHTTINQLPVTLLDFALISNMRHRAYGVRIFGADDCTDECCLNNLARQSLWRILFNIQQNLLGNKKIALSPMYVVEEQLLDPSQTTFFTQYGAVEKTNVVETMVSVGTLTLNPYVVADVNLTLSGGLIEARFDRTLVPNPHRTILRDSTTLEQFDWQSVAGYPKIDGTNWVMPVGNSMPLEYVDPGYQVNLYDYEYVVVDMANDASLDLTKLVVMHPNYQQILPFAKEPVRVVVGGTTYIRFTFYIWTLGKIEFANEKIDLVEGEYYKLYTSLPLYRRTETETVATIYIDQRDESMLCTTTDDIDLEVTDTAWTKIVKGESGILRYTEIEDTATTPPAVYKVKTSGRPYGRRYKIRYYYKVNPLLVDTLNDHSVEEVRRAIVAKTAATIELETCGCVCAANDYIQVMQVEYTKNSIDPLSGTEAIQFMYGHRRGDKIFAEVVKALGYRQEGVIL